MLEQMGIAAKAASYKLALLSSREKIAYWKKSPITWKHSLTRLFSLTSRTFWRLAVMG
jgi:glutamate-5-semialdehyde dehydrogenase